jgi:precorrin-6B methylase 2
MNAAPAPSPQARAMQIVQTAVAGKLVATLTEASVPDALAKAPRSVAELAHVTGLHADALGRALRAAESIGVFARTEDGRWRNTEVGAALCSGAAGSVRDYVVYALHDGNWRAWQRLIEALRTGRPTFRDANGGLSFWAYLDANKTVADAFHRAMAATAAVTSPALAGALDLARFRTVVDVGGGSGVVTAAVLSAASHLHAILFDRREAIDAARNRFAALGLLHRVTLETGDLFEHIPSGGDAYILKNILHDHCADDCARILEVLRRSMPDSARLFVVEAVLPDSASPHPAIWRDLHMLVALGGRERTEAEWRTLLDQHGFAIERMTPLPGPDAVIELRKRSAQEERRV